MSRIFALAVATTLVLAATASADTEFFRWSQKNIGCAINHDFIRCDSSVGSPVALVLHLHGPSEMVHTGGSLYSGHEPRLAAPMSIIRGHMRCDADATSLTCRNADHHGFTMNKVSFRRF